MGWNISLTNLTKEDIMKITKPNFRKAAKRSGGLRSLIAQRLKVSRSAITQYLERNPDMVVILTDELENTLDISEAKLFENIQGGDFQSIKLMLTTKGKTRGYVQRTEIVNSGNINVGILPLNESERNELLIDLKENDA